MNAGNIAWAIVAVTVIMGLMMAFSKKKKVMDKSKWIFAVPLLVVGIFLGLMQFGTLTTYGINPFAAGVPTQTQEQTQTQLGEPCSGEFLALGFVDVAGKCACLNTDGDTTVTLSASDKYTSVAAGTSHRYRINGNPALTVSDAGTFDSSPGNKVSILWGNESDTSYYGAVSNVRIPCAGTHTFTTELVQNGTLTIQAFNEEGNLVDSAGENETITAGDTVTLKAEIKGTFERGIPYGGVIIAEFNDTIYDDVEVNFEGTETAPEVSVPGVYSVGSTDSDTRAYSVPAILSNQILEGTIYIDADDSTSPGDGPGADINLTFYPNDYFINQETGGSYDGPAVEDEDDVQTFDHITTLNLNVDAG